MLLRKLRPMQIALSTPQIDHKQAGSPFLHVCVYIIERGKYLMHCVGAMSLIY